MDHVLGFLDHLAVERGLSANTVLAYGRDLRVFEAHLRGAGRPLLEAERADITSFLAQESRAGRSWATISRRLAALRTFYKFLESERLLAESPARDVPMPRKGERLPKTLRESEVAALLDKGHEDSLLGLRDRAILEVFYATGLRASELAGLKVSDVNFEFGFLRARGKGAKERIVPLGLKAIEAVKAYLSRFRARRGGRIDPEGPLFRSRTGGRLGREAVFRRVRRAASRAGLVKRVGPHTIRHSFASHLIAHGADLRAVQEMLGHSSVATTQVYTHVENRWLKKLHGKYHPRA